jgi:tetratricopeptide (TPR) repeat protein
MMAVRRAAAMQAARPRASASWMLCAAAAMALVLSQPAEAQTAQPAPLAKKAPAKAKPKPANPDEPAGSEASRDSNTAWRDYDAGVQAAQAGQLDSAVEKFSKVLAGSNVPAPLMAKTLLQRGSAFRQQGKPGQAIADLTSAIYLRGGLSDPERTDATAQRSAAYREAGLSEQGVAAGDKAPAPVVARAQLVPPAALPGVSGAGIAKAAAAPVAGLAPDAVAPAPKNQSTGLFSKIFGGGDSGAAAAPPPPPPAPQTAALSAWSGPETKPNPAAPAKLASANAATEVLPWERPAVAPQAADAAPARTAPSGNPKVAAKAGAVSGRFRLQLAAVMSREEAQATASRLKSQFAGELGSRAMTIDEAALGAKSMFIVRFGPYTNAAEVKELCTRIRAAGTDCMQAP